VFPVNNNKYIPLSLAIYSVIPKPNIINELETKQKRSFAIDSTNKMEEKFESYNYDLRASNEI
jgi:hypothetical protein